MKTSSILLWVLTAVAVLALVVNVGYGKPPQAPKPLQAPPLIKTVESTVKSCNCSINCTCGCNEGEPCRCNSTPTVVSTPSYVVPTTYVPSYNYTPTYVAPTSYTPRYIPQSYSIPSYSFSGNCVGGG